jgi:hypothetical protein
MQFTFKIVKTFVPLIIINFFNRKWEALTSIQSYQDESVTLEVWGEFLLTQIPGFALEMAVNLPLLTPSQLLTSYQVMTSHQHLTSSIMRSYLIVTSFQRMTSSQDNHASQKHLKWQCCDVILVSSIYLYYISLVILHQ